jgi:hypothetical protein
MSENKANDRLTMWIRWLARGIGAFFAVAYVYLGITTGPASPSLEEVAVVLSLLLGVLIAWWREGLGGLILLLTSVVLFLIMGFVVVVDSPGQRSTLLLLFVIPYLVPGLLFLMCWLRSKKPGMLLSSV